jgi:hypothetical protein
MTTASYDIVARVCMVSSLLLFVTFFLFVLIYVIRFTRADTLERVQALALDLPEQGGGA